MNKAVALLTIGLTLAPAWGIQEPDYPPPNPEMQRQEIIILEREAAHAIQLNDGTFFRRVLSDEFAGTLSHGQPVDKAQMIKAVMTPVIPYESFAATDIKVRILGNAAIANSLWSWRAIIKGQRINSVMRVIHVYVNTTRGWKVIAAQATQLPPIVQQPL